MPPREFEDAIRDDIDTFTFDFATKVVNRVESLDGFDVPRIEAIHENIYCEVALFVQGLLEEE